LNPLFSRSLSSFSSRSLSVATAQPVVCSVPLRKSFWVASERINVKSLVVVPSVKRVSNCVAGGRSP